MNLENLRIINFAHEEDGVFTHGTISTLDGITESLLDIQPDGGEFTNHTDVDEDDLDSLWDALNGPVFRQHVVRRPDAQLDFRENYIIGIMFQIRGELGKFTYLIPMDERDPEWLSWLKRIEATQRPG